MFLKATFQIYLLYFIYKKIVFHFFYGMFLLLKYYFLTFGFDRKLNII